MLATFITVAPNTRVFIMLNNKTVINLVMTCLMMIFSATSTAGSKTYTAFFSDLAVSGYDTVAYFTQGKPVKGSSDFTTQYQGATWQFSSQENLALFAQAPTKYAPQYGGYCAWAVSQGDTASSDPEAWQIVDDKLYLNYNVDIQNKWLKDSKKLILQADQNWPGVIN